MTEQMQIIQDPVVRDDRLVFFIGTGEKVHQISVALEALEDMHGREIDAESAIVVFEQCRGQLLTIARQLVDQGIGFDTGRQAYVIDVQLFEDEPLLRG